MIEMLPSWGWLFFAYVAGTGFGLWVKSNHTIEVTIDTLIKNGYLKSRKNDKGEEEIIKWRDWLHDQNSK